MAMDSFDPVFFNTALLGQAEQVCKQRLQRSPENRAVLRSLAEVCRKLGQLDEAATIYERLFQLDPQDQEAGYMHAVLAGKAWQTAPKGIRAAPFVLLKNFLPPDFHDALLPFFISVREKFVPVVQNGQYQPEIRKTVEYRPAWEGRTRFREYLMDVAPHVIERLHIPSFKLDYYTIQIRAYEDGHFFGIHWDAAPNRRSINRVINFVYYFHRLPKPYTGGALLLFDTDTEANAFTKARFTGVVPEDNSMIFFLPNYFHSVVPICCPSREFGDCRFVINGHFHKSMEANPGAEGSLENAEVASYFGKIGI
jgi:SM-20-related protein